jgi:hypothetical protein
MSVRWVWVVLAGLCVSMFGTGAMAADAPKPKPVKTVRQAAPECGWIGKRIIQLLSRDDVVAAGEFRQFYVAFGCSEAHLSAAFGCAVEDTGAADSCATRADCVDLCWRNPNASAQDKAVKAAPAPSEKAGASTNGKAKAAPPVPAAAAQAAKKPAEAKPVALPSGPYDKKQ